MDPISQTTSSILPVPVQRAPSKVAVEFDTMLLRSVVETMLPEDSAAVGGGVGADMWRSQLADAVAGQLARSGTLSFAALAGLDGEADQ